MDRNEENDRDIDAAWGAEIKRRIEDLGNGAAKAIPWPEARRMIHGEADGPSAE